MRRTAAGAACTATEPARPAPGGLDLSPARSRAALRLRGIALHVLAQTERCSCPADTATATGSVHMFEPIRGGCATAAPHSASAAPRTVMPEGNDHRFCMAARALSEMLCDEPNAARCRATVRDR